MPLRDHFHPPLKPGRHWQGLHNAWATHLAARLNRALPEGYFAEPNVRFGIEIDVATWESRVQTSGTLGFPEGSAEKWRPSAPALTLPFAVTTDLVEVLVWEGESEPSLVGAIELASPANKDRSEHREAFTAKCRTLLSSGVGIVLVDIVTERRASLHGDLLQSLGRSAGGDPAPDLYAAAYRPVGPESDPKLEVWLEELTLGTPLPVLPLWLRGGPCVPVDLDASYEDACRDLRIPPVG